ncbi:hypothetical protein KAR91_33900 [Candidatus Pacearchaeota archaeon]|nr:hypothetical protein [Candidatus Pacearchaeota archaeon]
MTKPQKSLYQMFAESGERDRMRASLACKGFFGMRHKDEYREDGKCVRCGGFHDNMKRAAQ